MSFCQLHRFEHERAAVLAGACAPALVFIGLGAAKLRGHGDGLGEFGGRFVEGVLHKGSFGWIGSGGQRFLRGGVARLTRGSFARRSG